MKFPLIIGHRGAKGIAPENSISGFEKAWELEIDGVELDVHRTRDNQLVVIHDANLHRLIGEKVNLKNLTFKELQKYNIAYFFARNQERISRRLKEEKNYLIELRKLTNNRYYLNVVEQISQKKISFYLFWDEKKFGTVKTLMVPRSDGIRKSIQILKIKKGDIIGPLKEAEILSIDQHIPLLKEVLEVLKKKFSLINIEVKGGERIYPGIIDRLVQEIEDFPVQFLLFSFFDRDAAFTMKKRYPHLKINCLSLRPLISKTFLNGLDGLNYYHLWTTNQLIDRLHQSEKNIMVWTVNKEVDMLRFILMGVDGIITDYPQILKRVVQTLKSLLVDFY